MADSKTQQPADSTWLTAEQVADYLAVSPNTVRNWVSQKYRLSSSMTRRHEVGDTSPLSSLPCQGRASAQRPQQTVEAGSPTSTSSWSRLYGDRHRYVPILDDPVLPNSRRGRVRIYRRGSQDAPGPQRFVLNWFENGKNCKQTVLGDKFTAVAEADRINGRLDATGRSGLPRSQVSASTLIDLYREHLDRRAEAGEISPRTTARYRSALQYIHRFVERTGRCGLPAGKMDEQSVLELKAYLRGLKIHPNGHPNSSTKPITEAGIRFIMSVARAAWHWAQQCSPPLLPEGAHNPFQGRVGSRPLKQLVTPIQLDTPQLTRLMEAADIYQLALLMPMILYGLRAAEPCYLMIEDWNRQDGWLTVACVPDLDYKTKGRTDKILPVPPVLNRLLTVAVAGRSGGPLIYTRPFFEGRRAAAPTLATKQQIIEEYQRRIQGSRSAQRRLKVLNAVLREAGAVTYDQLSREFRELVRRAGLPSCVTLKSLRHHFASALETANISYFTRKYLMGHRVRRDPLAIYTTTDFDSIRQEFDRLFHGPMAPVVGATEDRMAELGFS